MDNEAFRLIMLKGPQPEKIYSLTKEIIAIGRDTLNDVVVNDPEVSRQHSRMRYENGVYLIEDLGSTNGTFVNGVRITGTYSLADGDEVGLGETISLTFKASVAAATETIIAPSSDALPPPPPTEPEIEHPFDAGLPEEPAFAEPPPPFDADLAEESEPAAPPPPFPDDSLLDEPIAPPPPFDAGLTSEPETAAPPMPFESGPPLESEPAAPPPPFDAGFSEPESIPPPQPFQDEPAFAPPPPSPTPMGPPSRPPTTATPVGPPPAVSAAEKPKSRRNLMIGCGCLILVVICAFVLGFGYLIWNAPTSFFDDPIGNFGDLFGSIILPLYYLL